MQATGGTIKVKAPETGSMHIRITYLLVLVLLPVLRAPAQDLVAHRGEYYTIWTDLPPDAAREAQLRMTRMAQEYMARTRGLIQDARERSVAAR